MAAITPFGLRMQPDLRARMDAAAEANGRSLNAEICARLESSFSPDSANVASEQIALLQKQLADMELQRKKDAESARQKIDGLVDGFMALEDDMAFLRDIAIKAGAIPTSSQLAPAPKPAKESAAPTPKREKTR